MKWLERWIEPQVMKMAQLCRTSVIYMLRHAKNRWKPALYQISVDWSSFNKWLSQKTNQPIVLIGGLTPQSLPSSGAFVGENADYIIVNPGQLSIWLLNLFGWKRSIKEITARLLAHEARHILQPERTYGWRHLILLPAMILNKWLIVGWVLSTLAACFHQLSWLIPIGISVYLIISFFIYWFHWKERDARAAAKRDWQDVAKFIEVKIISD